jgi:TRAP-type C4-dicarboxylate transport system permease small subunit
VPAGDFTHIGPPPGHSPLARAVFVIWPRRVMGTLVLAAIAINCGNVIGRYVFGYALYWAEEILIFLTMWCVGLGIVVAAYDGAHLRMDLLTDRLTSPWREIVNAAIAAVFVLSCAFTAVQAARVVLLIWRTGVVSVAAGVPMVIPHTALLVGFVLMGLAVLVRWRAYVAGRF